VEPPPPGEKQHSAVQLSSRAKTNAFVATNIGRYDAYATAVARDFTALHYREDLDENDQHKGTELAFPPKDGTTGRPGDEERRARAVHRAGDDGVRDMISTLYVLRWLPMNSPSAWSVRRPQVWKFTGQIQGQGGHRYSRGAVPCPAFEGEGVRLDDARSNAPRSSG